LWSKINPILLSVHAAIDILKQREKLIKSRSLKIKLTISILFILSLFACSGGDWICKTHKNANGETVKYAENTKRGEIGAYSKCK
jgi:hypothetical protein